MRGYDYLPGVVSLGLDQDICVGCGICAKVCPHLVLEMQGGKAAISFRDKCMECGACALNCPVRAISVDAGVGCASGMINRWLAGFNIRLRNDDSCC
jgi:ferredoxin